MNTTIFLMLLYLLIPYITFTFFYSRKFGFMHTSLLPNISPDIHDTPSDNDAQLRTPPSDPT